MTKDYKKLIKESKYKGFVNLEKEVYGNQNNNLARNMQRWVKCLDKIMNKIGFETTFKKIDDEK